MAINFPNNPNINDVHASSGQSWKWDGTTWKSTGNTGDIGIAGINTEGTSGFNHIKVAGVSTFVGLATFNGYVDIGSGVHLQNNRSFNFGGTSFGSGGVGNDAGLSITSDPSISGAEIKTGGNTTDGTLVLRNKEVFVQDKSSVGIVTIRDGVTVSGMVTATAFSGDGSNLTNLPSAQGSSTVGGATFNAAAGQTEVIDTLATSNLTVDYNLYFSHALGKQSQQVTILNDGSNSHIQQSGITFNNHLLVSVGSSIAGGSLTINATPETGITGTIDYKFFRTEVS